ncbi:uncharacterized protein [Panulirus ornatus]|uniref:uncharacterized protein n=1 Tax=Panulirus ornatus TaxID=150431 RepID=UPI003A8923A6
MRERQLVLVTALAVLAVVRTEPQGLGVQVNNNALFTLGAGLLALGAGYYIGRQTAINDHRNGYRPNSGGFSPFFGRRRRQAEPENELDPLVGQLFQLLLEKDKSGCSLQLTCSIGGKPVSSLTGNARDLHSILSTTHPKEEDVGTNSEKSGLGTYQAALSVGRGGGECDQLFPLCPASSQQLMTQFQSMKIVQN